MTGKIGLGERTEEDVQCEADRIEELQAERRATARLAYEIQMIRNGAAHSDRKRQEEFERWFFERQEWDFTLEAIQIIWSGYE